MDDAGGDLVGAKRFERLSGWLGVLAPLSSAAIASPVEDALEAAGISDLANEKVASLHSKFMGIFPWAKESGRTIRIASNLLLQEGGYPVAIVTLKNRVLSPLVGLFIEHVREAAKSIVASQ